SSDRIPVVRPRFTPPGVTRDPRSVTFVVQDLHAKHDVSTENPVVQIPGTREVARLFINDLDGRVIKTLHAGSEIHTFITGPRASQGEHFAVDADKLNDGIQHLPPCVPEPFPVL